MLHYLCNTTCCGYLHCTLYTEYYFFFFLHNCVHLFVCLTYSSLCCNRSKSIDSINALYTFRYLVISSTLFSCKFIILFMLSLSRSLCSLVFVQWKRRWSIVWSSLSQMHVASSLKLNRWRYALVLTCPDSTAVVHIKCNVIWDIGVIWCQILFKVDPIWHWI